MIIRKKIILISTSIIFVLQLLVLATLLINYLLFTNTLENNKNWQVSKNHLYISGFDDTVFSEKTQALANNSLNLSSWRGWHEVSSSKHIPWKTLSLKLLANNNSYLYVIFHQTTESFSAVRISYSPLYQSAFITAKYTGEFIENIPINIPDVDRSGWQEITLKKENSQNHLVEFFYNREFIDSYSTSTSVAGNIAFRSGKEQILLDKIKLIDDQDQLVFYEEFDNLATFWQKFFFLTLSLIIIDLVIFIFLRNKEEEKIKSIIQFNFIFYLFVLLVSLTTLSLNSNLRSRYPKENSFLQKLGLKSIFQQNDEESFLENEKDKFSEEHSEEINLGENQRKIIVIGSSQTRGEGSSLEGEDFVSQFDQLIRENKSAIDGEFVIINAGQDGQIADSLFNFFKNNWLNLKPEVVIVNLSSNDEQYNTHSSFKEALENFVQASKNNNFLLVFVAEANSIEAKLNLETHQIMKDIAEKNQIIFIDMHDFLAKNLDKGIIWWDFVHPTSFGYELIANHLFDKLREELLVNELKLVN